MAIFISRAGSNQFSAADATTPLAALEHRQTQFPTLAPGTDRAACRDDCAVKWPGVTLVSWSSLDPSGASSQTSVTLTVATIFYIILDGGSTSTTTHSAIPSPADATLTSSTTVLTLTDGLSSLSTSLSTLTYPTPYASYEDIYSWDGQLWTDLTGSSTSQCVIQINLVSTTLPSHPPLLTATAPPVADTADPYGMNYIPVWTHMNGKDDVLFTQFVKEVFPDDAAFQSCSATFPGGEALSTVTSVMDTVYTSIELATVTSTVTGTGALPGNNGGPARGTNIADYIESGISRGKAAGRQSGAGPGLVLNGLLALGAMGSFIAAVLL